MIAQRSMLRLFCTALLALSLAPTLHADDFSTALERGTLRVGVSLFTPWTLRDPDGELRGFEIDVARQLAGDMGLEPEFQVYEWDRIINALLAGEIDVDLKEGTSDRIHVSHLLANLEGGEVARQ